MSVKIGILLCGIAFLVLPAVAEDCTDSDKCGSCTQYKFTDSTKTSVSCESCSFLRVAIKDKTMRLTSVSSTNKIGDYLCNSALMWVVVIALIILGVCCLGCAVWHCARLLRLRRLLRKVPTAPLLMQGRKNTA